MALALHLAIYLQAAFGLAYVVGKAKISQRPRELLYRHRGLAFFVDLIECPACFGFWIGLVAGVLLPPLQVLAADWFGFAPSRWETGILFSQVTVASNFILARLTGLIPAEH